ncbi:indoleamine 2,3-dioxygenase, partial [Tremellales sp. Uapishka_1]
PPPTHITSPLPSTHFLHLPPSFAAPTYSLPSTSSHVTNQAPNVSSLAAADFDVDVRTGFLPPSKNLERLSAEWELWEEALDAAKNGGLKLFAGEKERLWRKGIEIMPVLDTEGLRVSILSLRRAHLVLTFLLHFYAHTTPTTSPRTLPLPIPASIAVPLIIISPLLGLPPILTYSDTVLYNFHPLNASLPSMRSTNPPAKILTTFTGTSSEEHFFLTSALCEIAGSEALKLMRQSLDELFVGDAIALKRLTVYLKHLAAQIAKISDTIMDMMNGCDPEEFYHLIRPWFKGGDSEGEASLGWEFLGLTSEMEQQEWEAENSVTSLSGQGRGKGRKFSGPSAGQSSLIHALDVFLTVDHSPQPEAEPETPGDDTVTFPAGTTFSSEPTTSNVKPKPAVEATYLQRMLSYMPLPHRSFLLHLAAHPTPLRAVVLHHAESNPKLADAYDAALTALGRLREKHMRIVSVYIIQQARRRPSERIKRMMGMEHGIQEEEEEHEQEIEVDGLRGTGGTPLFRFLKMCRDNTSRAKVGKTGVMGS